jgi:hypothetical protein
VDHFQRVNARAKASSNNGFGVISFAVFQRSAQALTDRIRIVMGFLLKW